MNFIRHIRTAFELLEALAEIEAALRGKCTDYRQLDLFEQPAAAPYLLTVAR